MTDGQTDGQTIPSTLSPSFAVDRNEQTCSRPVCYSPSGTKGSKSAIDTDTQTTTCKGAVIINGWGADANREA